MRILKENYQHWVLKSAEQSRKTKKAFKPKRPLRLNKGLLIYSANSLTVATGHNLLKIRLFVANNDGSNFLI